MRHDRQAPESAASDAPRAHRRRSGALAVFVAAAAVALVPFSGTGSSHAASFARRSVSANRRGSTKTNDHRASVATVGAQDNSIGLLEQWAGCERSHGASNQADPTVEHEVIYIAVRMRAGLFDPQDPTDPCSGYLAAAQRAVAGGQPIAGWGDNALYVQYANCMRANGYPTFPYPSGIEPDGHERTNFNGTGIDPNSPALLNGNANQTCGTQIGAPAWWINNWGPPGSVDVYPAGTNPNAPLPHGPTPSGYPRVVGAAGATFKPALTQGLAGPGQPRPLRP